MHPILFCLQEYPLWSFFYGSVHFYVGWYFVFPLAKKKEMLRTFLHQTIVPILLQFERKTFNKMAILSHSTSARGKKMCMKNVRAWVSTVFTSNEWS